MYNRTSLGSKGKILPKLYKNGIAALKKTLLPALKYFT
jgi:hypothetical protein